MSEDMLPEKRGVGRPVEWTEDRIADAKELYIELLKTGKTERQCNAVQDLPCYTRRLSWKQDPDFKARCEEASKIGVDAELGNLQDLMDDALLRVADGELPPHYVSLLNTMSQYYRWKAGKLNNEKYGDKFKQELSGANGTPIEFNVTFISNDDKLIDVTPDKEDKTDE